MLCAGCGGSSRGGATTGAAAIVDGTQISVAEVEHWSAIKRAEANLDGAASSQASAREQALAYLITSLWLSKEAAAHGISETDAQAQATYEQLLRSPSAAGLTQRMKRLGMSASDERYQLRTEQLSLRLRAKVMASASGSQARRLRALAAFAAAFRVHWRKLTHCTKRYIVAECANGPAPAAG